MSSGGCTSCQELRLGVPLTLCGAGRSQVYGSSAAECGNFDDAARTFDAQIDRWLTANITGGTAVPSGSESAIVAAAKAYPGCRDALEVFFCAQTRIWKADDDGVKVADMPSECSAYRRPYREHGYCQSFCQPIRDACPITAHAYCEEYCRSAADASYCTILEISGLGTGTGPWHAALWHPDTLDMMNLYRLEAEAGVPILRTSRPMYRSIPARRPPGSVRLTKLDYYLYATNVRGYHEWLLDTNDIDTDGAQAVASDGNFAPYRVNSDWSIWSGDRTEWAAVPLTIRCRTESDATSAATPIRRKTLLSPGGRQWTQRHGSRFADASATAAAASSLAGALAALAALYVMRGPPGRRGGRAGTTGHVQKPKL